MALTTAQLLEIRRHIGSADPPSDLELGTLYEELGSTDAVALQVLSERLADMRAVPAEVDYQGDVTERWGKNIEALERATKGLSVAVATGGQPTGVTVGYMTRKGPRR